MLSIWTAHPSPPGHRTVAFREVAATLPPKAAGLVTLAVVLLGDTGGLGLLRHLGYGAQQAPHTPPLPLPVPAGSPTYLRAERRPSQAGPLGWHASLQAGPR